MAITDKNTKYNLFQTKFFYSVTFHPHLINLQARVPAYQQIIQRGLALTKNLWMN